MKKLIVSNPNLLPKVWQEALLRMGLGRKPRPLMKGKPANPAPLLRGRRPEPIQKPRERSPRKQCITIRKLFPKKGGGGIYRSWNRKRLTRKRLLQPCT